MAVDSSWCTSSSFTATLAILCERTFWRYCRSALRHILRGISTRPKPSRKAPVTSPKVLEQAIATPSTLFLSIKPHTFQANVISIFLFCNFVKYVDWQSFRRGMDQIWLEVGQETRILLESCFVLATYRNSFAKYGYF
jgi:hypothetical protein